MKLFSKETFGTQSTYYYVLGKRVALKTGNCLYIGNWYAGWHTWKFDMTYHVCGYDSGNANLHISLLGWCSVFVLPWKSKKFPHGDCDAPTYGIAIHNNYLWIYIGGDGNLGHKKKFIAWSLPFTYSVPCCRWDVECNYIDDGILKTKMMPYEIMKDDTRPLYEVGEKLIDGKSYLLQIHNYEYTDSYDGTKIPCKYWVFEQEWRPKWMQWCSLFTRTYRGIDVVFFGQLGRGKGTWKGGCTACSYEIRPGESPRLCIERMEREKHF